MTKEQLNLYNLVEIGARLREVRRKVGENQTIFAKRGGVGLQTQSRYEAGDTEPGAVYLARLAESGVDVTYVLTATESGDRLHPIETQLLQKMRKVSMEDALVVMRIVSVLGNSTEARHKAEREVERIHGTYPPPPGVSPIYDDPDG